MTEDATADTPAAATHPAPTEADAHPHPDTHEAPAPVATETAVETPAASEPDTSGAPEAVAETHAEAPPEVHPEPAPVAEPHPRHETAGADASSEAAHATEPAAEGEAPKPAKKPRPARKPKAATAEAAEDAEPVAPSTEPGVDADAESAVAAPANAGADVVASEPDAAHEEPTGTVAPTEPPEEPKPENKKKWYAIKVQSGREDTIKAAILRKVAIEGLEDVFGQIMIPFEEVIEKKTVKVKDKKTGEYTTQEKKVTRKKKKFQGYLFAELEFNDRMLYLFRETSGVGDFLNLRNKPGEPPTPEPMPEHEVQQMLTGEKKAGPGGPKKIKLEFEKGDRVRIREGSFANSEGDVKSISEPKDPTDAPKITVVVTFWGRPLDVELEYWQVAKV